MFKNEIDKESDFDRVRPLYRLEGPVLTRRVLAVF